MGLSPAINKLYLVSKLKSLESLDKMVKILYENLKMTFNLQYGKVISYNCPSVFWFLMTFCQEMAKDKLIPLFAQCKYSGV